MIDFSKYVYRLLLRGGFAFPFPPLFFDGPGGILAVWVVLVVVAERGASAPKATISTIANLCPNELSRYVGCRRFRVSARHADRRKPLPPPSPQTRKPPRRY